MYKSAIIYALFFVFVERGSVLAALKGYVDLHLHALPGLDDGVRSCEASLEMLSGLADVGFGRLVTTPHRDFRRWSYSESDLQSAYSSVVDAVAAADLGIDLGLGAEYTYGEQFHREINDGAAKTIGESRYVLVELPEAYMPTTIAQALFQVSLSGYYPILAHHMHQELRHRTLMIYKILHP